MRILFLHISDTHFTQGTDIASFHIDEIVNALNVFNDFDELLILFSGDITKQGKPNEFKVARHFLSCLIKTLKRSFRIISNKWINIFVVPGNHDYEAIESTRTIDEIKIAAKKDLTALETLYFNDIKGFSNFYHFAKYNKCFINDKLLVHNKQIKYGDTTVCVSLINSAIFSLDGGINIDKGLHYLPKKNVHEINNPVKSDLMIAIMHHNIEWFINDVKNELRSVFSNHYHFVITGHEHEPLNEVRQLSISNGFCMLQGGSLSGDKNHGKGFNAYLYESITNKCKGYSFEWHVDFYKHTDLLNEVIEKKKLIKSISANPMFYEKNRYFDFEKTKKIDDFFVLPRLNGTIIDDKNEVIIGTIETINDLISTIITHKKLIITGESKAGKTTLIKKIYTQLIDNEEDYMPLILHGEDLGKKIFDKLIEFSFREQYCNDDNSFNKYEHIPKSKRIILFDGIDRIEEKQRNQLINWFNSFFGTVVLSYDKSYDFDIKKQIHTIMEEKEIYKITIMQFYFDKRKTLIEKAYNSFSTHKIEEVRTREKEIINKMINVNIKFFRLDPDFIINFVKQYTQDFIPGSTRGINIFSMVYENNIKEMLIQAIDKDKLESIYIILQELAFYMHFEKKTLIGYDEVSAIIKKYNNDYRTKIKSNDLLVPSRNAQLFVEYGNEFRFKDKNLLSYFCAQALSRKSTDPNEDITEQLQFLLHNLCFSINSDIVLFMAYITNNARIINTIIESADEHFKEYGVYSFNNKDIYFLDNFQFVIKDNAPTKEEKREKENIEIEFEKEIKSSELIQLVNEYDYDEEDLLMYKNQLLKSIKYIDLISKILPAFIHNMKVPQQNALVELVYTLPNKFLQKILTEIQDDYNNLANEIYTYSHELHKEQKFTELNTEDMKEEEIKQIKDIIKKLSVGLIISIFEHVSASSANHNTIEALEWFDTSSNINYQLMNLMMLEKVGKLNVFKERSISLHNKTENKIIKSIIKLSVRRYFLNNEVKDVSHGQALLDNFFKNNETKQQVKFETKKTGWLQKINNKK